MRFSVMVMAVAIVFGGWLAAVLLVDGLGLGAELVGMSNRTYHYVVGALIVMSLLVWLRNRWREWQQQHRKQVGDENEMECLEEMADDYAQGRYDNRHYAIILNNIEQVINCIMSRP
jgi:hypothetical protein